MARLRRIDAIEAAAGLAGLAHLDPSGRCMERDIPGICANSTCFEVADDNGRAVVAVELVNGVLWVSMAGGGGGHDLCRPIDAVVSQVPGARAVAFQTQRRGLVRRGLRRGYRIAGYILKKDLP